MKPIKNVDIMQALARHIENTIPDNFGFVLLVTEYGDKGRMNYVSNIRREDVVKAMQEFIVKTEDSYGAHKL